MRVLDLKDGAYYREVMKIGFPIMLQNLIFNSLNLVDTAMIGGLGDYAIAAVGIANKYSFIFMLTLFGIYSGSSIFSAQFKGKQDVDAIRRVLGLSLRLGLMFAIPFTLVITAFPEMFIRFYRQDTQLVTMGSDYLRIVGWSYLISAVTAAFAMQSRGVGRTKPPLVASAVALFSNTIMNYLLIYGVMGFPELGVKGAAIATLIARVIELVLMLYFVYGREHDLAAGVRHFHSYDKGFVRRYLKTVTPVIVNEMLWALGVSLYTFFYSKISVEAVTTVQILDVINGVFFSIFIGFGNAIGVMIGNRIGAGLEKSARIYAARSVVIGGGVGVLLGLLFVLVSPLFLVFFNISAEAMALCRVTIFVYGIIMAFKIINMIMIVGVCRSGGDTVFAMIIDVGAPWLVGLPLAALGVLVLHLPLYWVVALVATEEFVKSMLGIWRLRSGKWLHNLVHDIKTELIEVPEP